MSDHQPQPDWWRASDGKWYPPQPQPSAGPPTVTKAPGDAPGAGSVLLNLLWVVLSGFWLFLAYLFAALIQAITIIGIPFAAQSLKLAGFSLWPFGRTVVQRPNASTSFSCVGNVLWLFLSGTWLALAHAITGVLLCITIVGIPLGIGNFKLIPLALTPFGKDIVKKGQVLVSDTTVAAF